MEARGAWHGAECSGKLCECGDECCVPRPRSLAALANMLHDLSSLSCWVSRFVISRTT